MSGKDDALQEIISIARRNAITLADISQAMTDAPAQAAKETSGILSKLFGYVGGIFVFAGVSVFVSMFWQDMSKAAHVIVTLGSGFVVFLMALASLTDKKYERAATPLFLIAAFLQPGGIFVMLYEYSTGGDPHYGVLYMAIYMIIQQGAALIAKQRSILAFSTIVFASIFFMTLFDLWQMNRNLIGTVIGASLLCISYAAGKSRHAAIAPFWYFISSVTLLFSAFDALEHTPFELAYLALTAFLVFLSTYARSRTLLLVSTLAMIWYIGYFTEEHFAHTLGWPLVLIVSGLAFIGFSSLAVKLNNKYIKKQG